MEVIVAEHAGFCFGVTKAVETVYEQINAGKTLNIYTFGPIIHNETVVSDLEKKGVKVINDIEDLKKISKDLNERSENPGEIQKTTDGKAENEKSDNSMEMAEKMVQMGENVSGLTNTSNSADSKGIIVIRSHGVTRDVQAELEKSGLTVIDATCPFVKRIHKVVDTESSSGKRIIVVGSANHPEVQGIVSYANGPVYVIESPEEAEKFSENKDLEYTLVSQTTFNKKKFQETVEIFKNNSYNINVVNTICNATDERQTEAEEIARKADVMIVIGGASSSNSRKLYDICSKECDNTYFIQTLDDLHLNLHKDVKIVGITAGASTPKNIIEEVQNYVRTNF
ncbi:MAG: 4-hydroxy-3-methylbut-2-enyl diphosphate reductase [Butyrivibrio sp.]|nr:4-hydroxy-3-methylbut-2-enyl diphosphate reductase [Butyrivibrio sp.]